MNDARLLTQERTCPVCGRTDGAVVYESNIDMQRVDLASFSSRKIPEYMHHRLVTCADCSLLYASPAPTEAFLEASYREASFDAVRESELAAKTYVASLRKAGHLTPVRALDIGAGDGAFMKELARNGFSDVSGFEPSAAPLALADPAIRARIRAELFDGSSVEADSFGLITCFQTIEHVYEPLRLVRDVFRALAPGGVAFLIAHNSQALSARILGEKSPIIDIEHLQLFNPKSARRLMSEAGFRDVRVFPIMNEYPIAYWLRLLPVPPAIKSKLLAALAGPLRAFGDLLVPLPAGNIAIIGVK
jgi:SAM-dependent methyltransferase